MAAYVVGASGLTKAIWLNSRASRVFAAFVALCLIAALAFLAGERHASRTTVLTGIPVVGWHEATITVGGWSYGITGASVA